MTDINLNLLGYMVSTIWRIFQYTLLSIFFYYIIISAFAWVRRKEPSAKSYAPVNRFAMLVAAHNESAVIASIINSLNSLNYPRNMYEIFIIADNCTDDTAEISRNCGAKVFERSNTDKRGKGHALEWMFDKLFKMEEKYDAVCVLDADNLVSSNFLTEMNKHICMGHEVIQGYLDSKNPSDSWISGNNSIAFWVGNRLFQLPRYYLGLSCVLGGTGFVVTTGILKEIGWKATCLTEDLEFSLRLILKNKKVYWAHDAVIYDEKPLTIVQSWRQRKRWMQGHADCMRRFFKKLLGKAIREGDFTALDSALYLLQPLIVVVNGFCLLAGVLVIAKHLLLDPDYRLDMGLSFLTVALMYITIFYILMERKFNMKVLQHFLLLPLYNFTWVPIIIQGFMDRDKNDWSHTLHTRVMDISEIEYESKDTLDKAG